MKYRIGICDDEISTCSELEQYITDYFKEQLDSVEVLVWNTAEEFIKDVPEKVRDRKSTRLNSSHANESRMPSSA